MYIKTQLLRTDSNVIYCMFCTTMKLAIDETPQYDGLIT